MQIVQSAHQKQQIEGKIHMHLHTHVWAHCMHIELLKMGSFLRLRSVTNKKSLKKNRENVTDNYKLSEAYFAFAPKCICTTYRVMSG